jgi:hypothetical protein
MPLKSRRRDATGFRNAEPSVVRREPLLGSDRCAKVHGRGDARSCCGRHRIGRLPLLDWIKGGEGVTIQEWGAIGEFVGAIAVVATLGYLATQIRYARLAASDASRQGRSSGVIGMMQMAIANPEYRSAWAKANIDSGPWLEELAGRLGVTPDEADIVSLGCCAWTYLHWSQFRSMKTKEDYIELENLVAEFYSRTPMSVVWNHDPILKAMIDPEFVIWVNGVLERLPRA